MRTRTFVSEKSERTCRNWLNLVRPNFERATIWLIAFTAAAVCDFGTSTTRKVSGAMFVGFAVVFGVMFLIERRRRFEDGTDAQLRLVQCGMSMGSGMACFIASAWPLLK